MTKQQSPRSSHITRVGGVGTGRVFQTGHLQAYPRFVGKAWLVGFFDLNAARARQARDTYAKMLQDWAATHPEDAEPARANIAELCTYDTLDALLSQVDLVDVCTFAQGRMAAATAALESGVHAMVEKPMARTWIEADRACQVAAARPDVYLALNDDNIYEPKYRVIHDLLLQGVIGHLQSLTLIRGSSLVRSEVLKSQASALKNGGGCLMDYGSHGMAGAWYTLGLNLKPVRVEAVKIAILYPNRIIEGDPCCMEVEDNAQIKVLFEDPETGAWATVFLEATWSGGHIGLDKEKAGSQDHGYLHLVGDQGVIYGTDPSRIVVTHWDGGETVVPLKDYPSQSISMAQEIGEMIDCVRQKRPPVIDVRFGAEVIAVVEAGYLSALWGRPVSLHEFKDFARGYVTKYGDNQEAEEALLADLLAPYRGSN